MVPPAPPGIVDELLPGDDSKPDERPRLPGESGGGAAPGIYRIGCEADRERVPLGLIDGGGWRWLTEDDEEDEPLGPAAEKYVEDVAAPEEGAGGGKDSLPPPPLECVLDDPLPPPVEDDVAAPGEDIRKLLFIVSIDGR